MKNATLHFQPPHLNEDFGMYFFFFIPLDPGKILHTGPFIFSKRWILNEFCIVTEHFASFSSHADDRGKLFV